MAGIKMFSVSQSYAEKVKNPAVMNCRGVSYHGQAKFIDSATGWQGVNKVGDDAYMAHYSIGVSPDAILQDNDDVNKRIYLNAYGIGKDKNPEDVRKNNAEFAGREGKNSTSYPIEQKNITFLDISFFVKNKKELDEKIAALDKAFDILRQYQGGKNQVKMFVNISMDKDGKPRYEVLSMDVLANKDKPEQMKRLEELKELQKTSDILQPKMKFPEMEKLMESKGAVLYAPDKFNIPQPDGTLKTIPLAEMGQVIMYEVPKTKEPDFTPAVKPTVNKNEPTEPEPEAFEPEQNAVGEDMDIPF